MTTAIKAEPKTTQPEAPVASPRDDLLKGIGQLQTSFEKMQSEMPVEAATGTRLFIQNGSAVVLLAADLGAPRSPGERRLLLSITGFGEKLDDYLRTAERDAGYEPIKPVGPGSTLATAFHEVVAAADEIDKKPRSLPKLEPVSTLLEQKLTFRQICVIYSADGGRTSPFTDEWGTPDEEKIRAEAKEPGSVLKDFVDPRLADVRAREAQEDRQINSLQRLARIMSIRLEDFKHKSDAAI